MSSLEERREARRRRRQQEQEESVANGTNMRIEDIEERLARRRREREERMKDIAAGVTTINGEDELERRRRERREARLRTGGGGGDDTPSEDVSSRRSRRRQQQEEESTDDTSSYRSRRRRGGDEDETPAPAPEPEPSVPDTSEADSAAEREREEEEARRREQEEEERRQAAIAEARRREEEEDRRREEEKERREEERRRRANEDAEFERLELELEMEAAVQEDSERRQRREEEKQQKLERVRQWTEDGHQHMSEHRVSANIEKDPSNSLKDKLAKFEHLKDQKVDTPKKKEKDPTLLVASANKGGGLRGKVAKFEQEIEEAGKTPEQKEGHSHKFRRRGGSTEVEDLVPSRKVHERLQQYQSKVLSSGQKLNLERQVSTSSVESSPRSPKSPFCKSPLDRSQRFFIQQKLFKIQELQKRFENDNTDDRSAYLGRWSTSESHIDDTAKNTSTFEIKNKISRWKQAASSQKDTQSPQLISHSRAAELNKHLGGNTGYLASRFLEKANKGAGDAESISSKRSLPSETTPVKTPLVNGHNRQSSQSSDTMSDYSDSRLSHSETGSSRVTDRWQVTSPSSSREFWQRTSVSSSGIHNRSSYDNDSVDSHHHRSPGYRQSSFSAKQEEEERLEQERLEREREEAEEAARMAAEEEKKKKKGKRKGLGGLSPEKKKMLKNGEDLDDSVEYDSEEEEEKRAELEQRIPKLPADFEYLSKADLQKLCKELHAKVAQLEEEVYDWECKIRKQETEITDLTMKVNDSKGKFAKPVLRKVNKTDAKFEKLSHKKKSTKPDFRDNLKSTGHQEDEEVTIIKSPDWRDILKKPSGKEAF